MQPCVRSGLLQSYQRCLHNQKRIDSVRFFLIARLGGVVDCQIGYGVPLGGCTRFGGVADNDDCMAFVMVRVFSVSDDCFGSRGRGIDCRIGYSVALGVSGVFGLAEYDDVDIASPIVHGTVLDDGCFGPLLKFPQFACLAKLRALVPFSSTVRSAVIVDLIT